VGSLFPSSAGFPVAAKWMQPPAHAPEWNVGGSFSDLVALARRSEQEVIGLLETSAKNAQAILELRQERAGCVALKNTVDDAAAAARMTALTDATVEQCIRDALANERRRHEADVQRLRDSLADERRRREAENSSANLALVERRRLAEERRHHEAAKQAAASAERALAEERCRHDAAARAAASAELALTEERRAAKSAERALAEERCRHEARAAALAELALVEEGRCHNIAAQATEWRWLKSAVAMRRPPRLPRWRKRRSPMNALAFKRRRIGHTSMQAVTIQPRCVPWHHPRRPAAFRQQFGAFRQHAIPSRLP